MLLRLRWIPGNTGNPCASSSEYLNILVLCILADRLRLFEQAEQLMPQLNTSSALLHTAFFGTDEFDSPLFSCRHKHPATDAWAHFLLLILQTLQKFVTIEFRNYLILCNLSFRLLMKSSFPFVSSLLLGTKVSATNGTLYPDSQYIFCLWQTKNEEEEEEEGIEKERNIDNEIVAFVLVYLSIRQVRNVADLASEIALVCAGEESTCHAVTLGGGCMLSTLTLHGEVYNC